MGQKRTGKRTDGAESESSVSSLRPIVSVNGRYRAPPRKRIGHRGRGAGAPLREGKIQYRTIPLGVTGLEAMKTILQVGALLVAASLWSAGWNYWDGYQGFGWRTVIGALGYVPLVSAAVIIVQRRLRK